MEILGIIFIALACFLLFLSTISITKVNDGFSKLHATSISETAATILYMLGSIIYLGFNKLSLKIFLIMIIMLLLGPLSTYLLGRYALLSGKISLNQKVK